MGALTVITGEMFAGKSSELITLGERHLLANHEIAYFIHQTDTRKNGNVHTHSGKEVEAYRVDDIQEIILIAETDQLDAVLIDETQFFHWNRDEVKILVEYLTLKKDFTVYVAGLDMDYSGTPFTVTAQFMALADEVKKVHAVCSGCGDNASHSFKYQGSNEVIQVGAVEFYKPLCRECYRAETINQKYLKEEH